MRREMWTLIECATGSSSLTSDQRERCSGSDSPRSLKRCLVRPAFALPRATQPANRNSPSRIVTPRRMGLILSTKPLGL